MGCGQIETNGRWKLTIRPAHDEKSKDSLHYTVIQLANQLRHVIVCGIPTVKRAVIQASVRVHAGQLIPYALSSAQAGAGEASGGEGNAAAGSSGVGLETQVLIVGHTVACVGQTLDGKGGSSAKRYQLFVEGTGLQEVMATAGVKGREATSNHVMEMQQVLGIEAARSTIMKEIGDVLSNYGIAVDQVSHAWFSPAPPALLLLLPLAWFPLHPYMLVVIQHSHSLLLTVNNVSTAAPALSLSLALLLPISVRSSALSSAR